MAFQIIGLEKFMLAKTLFMLQHILVDPESDSLAIIKTIGKKEGIEDLYIKDMVVAEDGLIIYGTQNGQFGQIVNDKVTNQSEALNKKVAINTMVFANSKLYIGTAGSGIWWSNTTSIFEFQKLTGNKVLTSENVYQLIFDNQGYLWAGSERGVDKVLINQDNTISDVFHFGRNDGFLGVETCLNAIEEDNNGNLWFGTLNGLTQFQPSETDDKSTKPTISFQDVKVAYKSVDSINLESWTNSKKVLKLSPKQRQVSFNYTTIDLDLESMD